MCSEFEPIDFRTQGILLRHRDTHPKNCQFDRMYHHDKRPQNIGLLLQLNFYVHVAPDLIYSSNLS
uniref:Uncharacterized protein n=1 Tax=Arion vulgaris TaxID=1028688 RepID=A0A0B6ZFU9_9EUPU